ncbi:MAG: outer membrane lipoprotein-sorting protein [Flammeovirgaceae bacterium]|jgi:outer membrane lipoprotein carrier protein
MKKLLAITALFSLLFSSQTFAQQDPEAKKILENLKTKYEAYGAFKITVNQKMMNAKGTVMNDLSVKATVKGNKYILDLGDQIVYNNERKIWRHLVEDQEVYIYNNNSEEEGEEMFQSPTKLFNMHKNGFKYTKSGTETVAGARCNVIELAPTKTDKFQFFKVRLYVSTSDNMLKQWTVFEKDPDTLEIIRYKYAITKFTPNLKLTDGSFTFDQSKFEDVEVIDMTE